jgi:hypothetical protein
MRNIYDPCVYINRVGNNIFEYIILVFYVDDMLIVAKNKFDVDELKVSLSTEFEMKNMGKAKRIRGMDLASDINTKKLWLTQTKYIEWVVARFNTKDPKPISLSLVAHFKFLYANFLQLYWKRG